MASMKRPSADVASGSLFGDVLRQLRRVAGMTQEELAELARLSPRGLSDLERGVHRYPRRETVLALADALQLADADRARLLAAARRRLSPDMSTVDMPGEQLGAVAPSVQAPGSTAPAIPLPLVSMPGAELDAALAELGTPSAAPAPDAANAPEVRPESQPHQPQRASHDAVHVFLIADVRGYTRYTYERGDEQAARLAMRFAEVARTAVEARGGQVLELRGDEVLAVFGSARAALRAAVELQQRLRVRAPATSTHPDSLGHPHPAHADPSAPADPARSDGEHAIPCGIGLDAGEAIPVEGGYRGLALNLAARLCSLAGPGEVLASETVVGLARVVEGLSYVDRGLAALKGFATRVRVIQVVPSSAAAEVAAQALAPLPSPDIPTLEPEAEDTPPASTPPVALPPTPLSPAPPSPAPLLPIPPTPAQRLPIGGYLGALADGPLVGRETQQAQLLAAIESVAAGTAAGAGRGLVLLAGEPGIGKTRLAQEVTQLAHARGFLIASGRCYEPRTAIAYYPFLEALAMAYAAAPAALRAALPHRWPDVARLLPDLEMDSPPTPPATAQPARAITGSGTAPGADDQQRLFHQVTAFLQALAEVWPVALLLDDLHWADSVSLDLLQHLARHTPASRILLLGTYRDSEITPAHPFEAPLRDLGREHLVTRLSVRRLTPDGTAALLAASLGAGQEALADDFSALLHAHAEGNPFFTAELLRELVERGDLYHERGQWHQRAQVELVLPESVRSVIGQRLAGLSSIAQEVLREASVLGPAFGFTDLQAMSAFNEEEVEAALEEAAEAVLVREAEQASYVFPHVLIQQALYAQLSARRKQRLHRAAGEALERLGERERERRVAELAYHFARTDQHQRTLAYATQAAERAREAGARREEAALLGQALDAALHLEERQLVTELRVKRGRAFNAAVMWDDGRQELQAALAELTPDGAHAELALEAEQAELRIAILVELASANYFSSGYNVQHARGYATEALAVAERIGREDLAARALSELAMCDANEGLIRESQPQFERAFAQAGADHMASLLFGLDQYGLNWYYLGHFEQANIYTRQALAIAQRKHDSGIVTRTLGNLGMALTGCGRYDEALAVFAEARQQGREYRTGQWLARAISMHAGLHLALGDYIGAQALTEEAREVNRAIQFPNVTASTGIDLLLSCARRHEAGRAEGLLPRVREDVTKAAGAHIWLMELRFAQAQAEIALARGAWDEALRFADESIAQARLRGRVKYEVLGLQTRAQALAGQGHTNDAIAELRAAIALARPMGDPALLLRVVATLLAIKGDDALLAEARATVERIATALPDDLRRTFLDTDTVQLVARLSH